MDQKWQIRLIKFLECLFSVPKVSHLKNYSRQIFLIGNLATRPHRRSQLPNKTVSTSVCWFHFHLISVFLFTPQFPSANFNFSQWQQFFLRLAMFCCRWPSSGLFDTFNHFCAARQTISISDTCKCLFTTRNNQKRWQKLFVLQKFTGCTLVLNRSGAVCNVTVALNASRVEANQVQLFVLRNVWKCSQQDFSWHSNCVFYLQRALGSCQHSTQIDATLAKWEANARIIALCMGVKVGFIVHPQHPVHIFLLYFASFLHKYASVATVHNESVLTLK